MSIYYPFLQLWPKWKLARAEMEIIKPSSQANTAGSLFLGTIKKTIIDVSHSCQQYFYGGAEKSIYRSFLLFAEKCTVHIFPSPLSCKSSWKHSNQWCYSSLCQLRSSKDPSPPSLFYSTSLHFAQCLLRQLFANATIVLLTFWEGKD